jgi:5-oxoprolinase (ATP-hydrolysing) subunit B
VTPRVLPYGPGGWLVEVGAHDVGGYAAAVRDAEHPGVAEVVPAARTVLVRVGDAGALADVGEWLGSVAPVAVDAAGTLGTATVEIPVVYDGEDLAAVAAACRLTVGDVVARHTAVIYLCAFCGFAPGFAYLSGLDPVLQLPRRATPRTRVPAGSVAIAAEYAAVYPSESPGGWHLIGRTELAMWDTERDPPAAVPPGTAVRFVAVGP